MDRDCSLLVHPKVKWKVVRTFSSGCLCASGLASERDRACTDLPEDFAPDYLCVWALDILTSCFVSLSITLWREDAEAFFSAVNSQPTVAHVSTGGTKARAYKSGSCSRFGVDNFSKLRKHIDINRIYFRLLTLRPLEIDLGSGGFRCVW